MNYKQKKEYLMKNYGQTNESLTHLLKEKVNEYGDWLIGEFALMLVASDLGWNVANKTSEKIKLYLAYHQGRTTEQLLKAFSKQKIKEKHLKVMERNNSIYRNNHAWFFTGYDIQTENNDILKEEIVTFLRKNDSEKGENFPTIKDMFKIEDKKLRIILDELIQDILIYKTGYGYRVY